MKRIISMLIMVTMFLILLSQAMAGLNDGVVAYWPFNGNANDESGNGNNGTVNGATLTADRFGNPGSAYSFDGVNDYISTPVRDRNPISVSLWTKTPIQNYLWNAIITSHIYHQDSGHFTISNSYYRNGVVTVTSISSNSHDLVGNTPIDDNQWHHITMTSDGLTNRLYVDSKLEDIHSGRILGGNNIYIGTGEIDKPTRLNFQGVIDDIRVYNRALSENEIQQLFSGKCSFVDVPPGYWAEDAICTIYDEGITKGCSQNPLKYCPKRDVTRDQMAAFLVRAVEGEPPANYCGTGSPFSDVSPATGFCKYIKRLSELGITKGCGGGKYCPKTTVKRDQMAAFLVRAAEGEPPANYCGTGSPFSDVSPSDNFCKYIKRLSELGITKGCGGDKYCPKTTVKRDQMAVFLGRAFLGMD